MARRGDNTPDNPRERRWQREKRERQRERIVKQLNLLHQAGFTDEDIRAQGNRAWKELAGEAYDRLRSGQTQPTATTPGAVTAPTTAAMPTAASPYATATAAPAWAQASQTGPATTAQSLGTPPTQWWQRGTPTAAVVPNNPFSGVTGSVGTSRTPPKVPAWLGTLLTPRPSVVGYNPGMLGFGQQRGVGMSTSVLRNPSAVGSRIYNPMTGIPDFPMLASLGDTPTSGFSYGSSGYSSSNWYPKRRGRGGRKAPTYTPTGYVSNERDNGPYVPSSGQAAWQIG